MKLSKAIEILELNYQAQPRSWYKDYFAALKMGIEAMKRIDDQRNGKVLPYDRWLPGETDATVNKVDWEGSRDYIGKVGGEE